MFSDCSSLRYNLSKVNCEQNLNQQQQQIYWCFLSIPLDNSWRTLIISENKGFANGNCVIDYLPLLPCSLKHESKEWFWSWALWKKSLNMNCPFRTTSEALETFRSRRMLAFPLSRGHSTTAPASWGIWKTWSSKM